MADTEYTIEVQAEGIGTDSTADEIVALGDKIDAADKVITRFDKALEVAGAKLAEQADAAARASAALEEAESKYNRLERAAVKAAKKVEKAAAAGKDTTQLQAAADAAAAAVREQAQAVDRAAAEADAAAAAQKKLARAYRSVEKAAGRAAEETRGTQRSFGDLFGAAGALGGPLGGLAGQISGIGDGLRAGGKGGGLILGVFALGNVMIMAAKAAAAFTLVGLGVVAMLLKFAIAADEATSKKLEKAWERAGKHAKKLFEGVKTERLVRPISSLLNLLNENTSAGKGLAKIFETLLNPIIEGFDKAEPMIKEFFKGLILGALRAIIFVLKLRNAVAKAIPKETREKIKKLVASIFSLKNAAKAGEEAFNLWFLPFKMFIVLATEAGLKALWLAEQLEKFSESDFYKRLDILAGPKALIKSLEEAGEALSDWASKVYDAAADATEAVGDWASDAYDAAADFVKGLAQGLVDGVGAIAKAAKGLADAAINAIKDATKSSSPSKLMIAFGQDDFAGAMAIGMRRGVADVEQAGSTLGEAGVQGVTQMSPPAPLSPPRQPMSPTASPTGGTRAGGAQISLIIGPNGIVVQAPSGDGEDIAQTIRRVLLSEVEGAVVQLGGGEAVAGTI